MPTLEQQPGIVQIACMTQQGSIVRTMQAVDHCVLPVADLLVARRRYEMLGFTVAPDGVHPFGTRNACVYFRDGTFLEPLAVDDRQRIAAAIAQQNVFVARNEAFRNACGKEGFSALVLATDDARLDDRRFAAAGISAGTMLDFSREHLDADGRRREVSFRLAFAAPAGGAEVFFFTCQKIGAGADRGTLARHRNGVSAIAGIVMVADRPHEQVEFLSLLTGAPAIPEHGATAFVLGGGVRLALLSPQDSAERYGEAPVAGSGLRFGSIRFLTDDLNAARACLDEAGTEYTVRDGNLLVGPSVGQGTHFCLEAA